MARRWNDATGVVTPEAVELRFQEANVGSRTVALLLDFLILGLALWLLNQTISWVAEGTGVGTGGWIAVTVLILLNFLLLFGYPIAFETLTHGKTPGKAAMGLRVVTTAGAPVRFRHTAIRAAFWIIDFFATAGVAAVLATLLSKRHQRLGDRVAGTVVLRERTAATKPQVAHFEIPRGAEPYAATVDASAMSSRDYEIVREFLLREPSLVRVQRDRIALRLASALADKFGHRPPKDIGAVVYLTCLAARYQERQRPVPEGGLSSAAAQRPEEAPVPPPGEWQDFAPPR
ncbi:MAG: hypothetical protein GEU74_01970 [Nitriliruptorales bacterium]|nr:hypothetical protein [Nitriliruptorales bacterium]